MSNRWNLVILGVLVVFMASLLSLYFVNQRSLNNISGRVDTLNKAITSLQGDVNSLAGAPVDQQSVSAIMTEVKRAVVRVSINGNGFVASGSGFFIDNAGYILTNHHVIDGAADITVTTADESTYPAHIAADDASRDLTLLKLDTSQSDFPALHFDLSGDPEAGEQVLVAGFPLGLELSGPVSFSRGIVSAVRLVAGLKYIQTDAAINSGNSGGPLVDLTGKVVGVCTANITSETDQVTGLGLVIPVGDALNFITSGKVPCDSCHEVR